GGGKASQQISASGGKSGYFASTFNLAKTMIGGGMLALPAGVAAGTGTGWVPAFSILLFSATMSGYTFHLVSRCVEYKGAKSFKELWAQTLGERTAWVVDAAISALCFGVCIMYACFLGDLFSSLLPYSRTECIIGITGLVLLPLCLLRDLSALSFSSLAGLAAVLYVTFFSVLRAVDGSYAEGGRFLEGLPAASAPVAGKSSLFALCAGSTVLFSMLSTSFTAHSQTVAYYNDLENASAKKFKAVVITAFSVAAIVYSLVMASGYLTFGQASQGLILNNYHPSADTLATLARAATGVSIICGQPLLFTGLRDAAFSTFKTVGLLPVDITARPMRWSVVSSFMLAAATAIAIATPDVGLVVSLVGSLLGAGLCFTMPAMMYLSVMRDRKRAGLKNSGWEVLGLHLVAVFGCVMTVVGT
ncbi:unnamed protein product, partial [Chrysoparadoxa australica]